MKTRLELFTAITKLVLAVCFPTMGIACGFSYPEDAVRFSLFRPDVMNRPSLEFFSYTHSYGAMGNSDFILPDYQRNCMEWHEFSRKKAIPRDIYYLQYVISPDDFIYAYSTGNWEGFKDNTFVQWMRQKQNVAALEYMAFAKAIEHLQLGDKDPWRLGIYGSDLHKYDSLAAIALKKVEKSSAGFLKERYAFQAVKLLYYRQFYGNNLDAHVQSDALIACYDRYLKDKPTIVAAWGMLYYAMVQQEPEQRLHYLLKTFDLSEEKKDYVFQFIERGDLEFLEERTSNKSDLLLVKAIRAIKSTGKTKAEIEYIWKNDPGNKYLPLLIAREVNKLEDWIWSAEVLGFSSMYPGAGSNEGSESYVDAGGKIYDYYLKKNLQKDRAYLGEMVVLLQSMVQHGASNEGNFLKISLAHLLNMQKNYKGALIQLGRLDKKTLLPVQQKQAAVEQCIAAVHTEDITTEASKQRLFHSIKALENAGITLPAEHNYWSGEETGDDLGELLIMLSHQYLLRGDVVTAALLRQKSQVVLYDENRTSSCPAGICYERIATLDRYGSPSDVDKLIALINKKEKTEFEQYLATELSSNINIYYDLKATMLMRQEKFREALEVLNKMPDDYWAKHYGYSNYLPQSRIGYISCILPAESRYENGYPYCSKKLIVKDIVDLQQAFEAAKSDKEAADIATLLGNAFYNMTFYGKAWMAVRYGWSDAEVYDFDRRNYGWLRYASWWDMPDFKNYYLCAGAKEWYQTAFRMSGRNKEAAVASLFMLSKCDEFAYRMNKKRRLRWNNWDCLDEVNEEAYSSHYYELLRSRYKETAIALCENTCPDALYGIPH